MITHNVKITEFSMNKIIFTLSIFYIILSTCAILDIYFVINYLISTLDSHLLILIFTIIFPITLLIESILSFLEFNKNSEYEYNQINENLEIINSNKIFELDFTKMSKNISTTLRTIFVCETSTPKP